MFEEKAFRFFFIRQRTPYEFEKYTAENAVRLRELGAWMVKKAFIYQNNIYIHFLSPDEPGPGEKESLLQLYDVFNISRIPVEFHFGGKGSGDKARFRAIYIDYNGNRLSGEILRKRETALKRDISDIADMILAEAGDKRREVIISVKDKIIDNLKRVDAGDNSKPNLYLSRVECVVPMNYIHILEHLKKDNVTDVTDMLDFVKSHPDSVVETDPEYLKIPESLSGKSMYSEIDAYPRYVPLYVPELLFQRWNRLLYRDIGLNENLMNFVNSMHFKGYSLFSYEKAHIIKDRVKSINEEIRSNHLRFYLTDLTMGIAFPFMISLFAFIHLKTEIAFLLMYKNRIREILLIFWMLPVGVILFIKCFVPVIISLFAGSVWAFSGIILPLAFSFIAAAAVFYPVNRWCFSQFTGSRLDIYALHKGR
jgi:hypothetical protein